MQILLVRKQNDSITRNFCLSCLSACIFPLPFLLSSERNVYISVVQTTSNVSTWRDEANSNQEANMAIITSSSLLIYYVKCCRVCAERASTADIILLSARRNALYPLSGANGAPGFPQHQMLRPHSQLTPQKLCNSRQFWCAQLNDWRKTPPVYQYNGHNQEIQRKTGQTRAGPAQHPYLKKKFSHMQSISV